MLENFQRLTLVLSTLYHGRNASFADILQNGLELVGCWWVFGDVQLELGSVRGRLCRVVAGLILGGMLRSICRCLLEEIGNSHGGGRAGLVEEGDDVFGLVLLMGQSGQRLTASDG